jgi:hypothetical protein
VLFLARQSQLTFLDPTNPDFEALINKIPGVISSRVVMDNDTITELHVLSNFSRTPKQIIRDIQSALMAGYDMELDHKVISVAQIEDGKVSKRAFRLKLKHIDLSMEENRLTTSVHLARGSNEYSGSASGGASAYNRYRLVAEAALAAVNEFLGIDPIFILADVLALNTAAGKAFTVIVTDISGIGEQHLIGSAMVQQDEHQAVVKATLNAVNRRLDRLQ